jgi:hypothetical protein
MAGEASVVSAWREGSKGKMEMALAGGRRHLIRMDLMDLDLARLIRPPHAKTFNLLLGFTRISGFLSAISVDRAARAAPAGKMVPSFSAASKQSNASIPQICFH